MSDVTNAAVAEVLANVISLCAKLDALGDNDTAGRMVGVARRAVVADAVQQVCAIFRVGRCHDVEDLYDDNTPTPPDGS